MVVRRGPKEWAPELPPPDVREFHIDAKCLVIRAPEWFARADFQEWRRSSGVAAWHEREVEGQDLFIVYADAELDWHTQGMPQDIFRKIMRMIDATLMGYGVVWIKAV